MGRGKQLNDFEKGQIKSYSNCGLNQREIAQKIGRSQNVVSNYLHNEATYGHNMKGGVPYATNVSDRRLIIRAASNSRRSAAKIRLDSGVSASLSTVKRVIRTAKWLKRMKLQKKTTSQCRSYGCTTSVCTQACDMGKGVE